MARASRSVIAETPSCAAKSASGGSCSPSVSSPSCIAWPTRSATSSARPRTASGAMSETAYRPSAMPQATENYKVIVLVSGGSAWPR